MQRQSNQRNQDTKKWYKGRNLTARKNFFTNVQIIEKNIKSIFCEVYNVEVNSWVSLIGPGGSSGQWRHLI